MKKSFPILVSSLLISCGGTGTGAKPGDRGIEGNLPLYFTVTGTRAGEGAVYRIDQLERGKLSAIQLVADGLNFPAGLTVDATGAIYVAEKLPAPDGTVKRIGRGESKALIFMTGLHNPVSVAVNSFNQLYVIESDSNRVTRSGADGRMGDFITKDIALPRDMKIDHRDRVLLTELDGGIVSQYNANGERRELIRGLKNPFGAAVDATDNIYVLENGSGGSDGKLISVGNEGVTTIIDSLVNPIALTYNDAHGFFIIEGAPANRIINYSTQTGTLKIVAETGGNPYGIAMSPLSK